MSLQALAIKAYAEAIDVSPNLYGFAKHVRKVSSGEIDFNRVPDAWWETTNDRGIIILTALEVEDTSKLTESKMRDYAWLWFGFDCTMDYELELIVVDRYGQIPRKIDLMNAYYDLCIPRSANGK